MVDNECVIEMRDGSLEGFVNITGIAERLVSIHVPRTVRCIYVSFRVSY
jgi:hypothetical protein